MQYTTIDHALQVHEPGWTRWTSPAPSMSFIFTLTTGIFFGILLKGSTQLCRLSDLWLQEKCLLFIWSTLLDLDKQLQTPICHPSLWWLSHCHPFTLWPLHFLFLLDFLFHQRKETVLAHPLNFFASSLTPFHFKHPCLSRKSPRFPYSFLISFWPTDALHGNFFRF